MRRQPVPMTFLACLFLAMTGCSSGVSEHVSEPEFAGFVADLSGACSDDTGRVAIPGEIVRSTRRTYEGGTVLALNPLFPLELLLDAAGSAAFEGDGNRGRDRTALGNDNGVVVGPFTTVSYSGAVSADITHHRGWLLCASRADVESALTRMRPLESYRLVHDEKTGTEVREVYRKSFAIPAPGCEILSSKGAPPRGFSPLTLPLDSPRPDFSLPEPLAVDFRPLKTPVIVTDTGDK